MVGSGTPRSYRKIATIKTCFGKHIIQIYERKYPLDSEDDKLYIESIWQTTAWADLISSDEFGRIMTKILAHKVIKLEEIFGETASFL